MTLSLAVLLIGLTHAAVGETHQSAPVMDAPAQSSLATESEPDRAAQLEIRVTGLPTGEFRDVLDPELVVVSVTVVPHKQQRVVDSMTVATADEPLLLDLPIDVACKGSLTIGAGYNCTLPGELDFMLEKGEAYLVELDFGLERMVRTQINDVPCSTLEGMSHEGGGPGVRLAVPGRQPRVLETPFRSHLDAEGRGYFPVGDGDRRPGRLVRGGGDHCFELEARSGLQEAGIERAETKGVSARECWQLSPAGVVVGIHAAPGQRVDVAGGRVAAPRNGFGRSFGVASNVQFLTDASPEWVTLFVDKEFVGSLAVADVFALGRACIPVDELPFLDAGPNLQITVSGANAGPTPELPWLRPARWTLYLTRVGDELMFQRASPVFRSTGAIVAPGESGRNMETLARWDQEGGATLTATATLEPGNYWAVMKDREHGITYCRSAPIRVMRARMEVLQIELDQLERHVVVARHPGGEEEAGTFSRDVRLLAGSAAFSLRRNRGWRPDQKSMPDERYAEILTASSQPNELPTEVMLSSAPGGNGMMVPLRPAVPEDKAGGATLVAEIPRAYRVYAELHAVEGGRIYGFSDASRRDAEPPLFRMSTIHYDPRTVQMYKDKWLGVIARGPEATGIVKEMRTGQRSMVRDWFYATREGLKLAGNGKGRWTAVVNRLDRPVIVAWVPEDPDARGYLPEFAGRLDPGREVLLWVPAAARALRWYTDEAQARYGLEENWTAEEGAVLGEIADLDGPRLELR